MRPLPVTLSATVTALTLALTLSACGGTDAESEETSPGDVAMLYADALAGDPEGLRDYNPDSSWDDSYFESLGDSAEQVVGETLDAEQTDQVAAAYREALGKVEAEVADEQVDGDTASVTLAVRGLGYDAAMEVAAAAWQLDRKDPTGSYTELLLETLDLAEPVDESMDVEMAFTRSGDVWVPDGESGARMIQALMR